MYPLVRYTTVIHPLFYFHNLHLLVFEDDMKIFLRGDSLDDRYLLRNDLKCQSMTFTCIKTPLSITFSINNTTISSLNSFIRNLGMITPDGHSYTPPNHHINVVCCKTFKMLGIVIHIFLDFN